MIELSSEGRVTSIDHPLRDGRYSSKDSLQPEESQLSYPFRQNAEKGIYELRLFSSPKRVFISIPGRAAFIESSSGEDMADLKVKTIYYSIISAP
jgi:hypothetical protein